MTPSGVTEHGRPVIELSNLVVYDKDTLEVAIETLADSVGDPDENNVVLISDTESKCGLTRYTVFHDDVMEYRSYTVAISCEGRYNTFEKVIGSTKYNQVVIVANNISKERREYALGRMS